MTNKLYNHKKRILLTLLGLLLLSFQPASAAPGDIERVSVNNSGSQGNNSSFNPSISGDGRFVAFQSAASNLVVGDTNGAHDIFVHDRQMGTTIRVSVNTSGSEGNGNSQEPSISEDGRFVAFSSEAANLVVGDTNGVSDIFVHDRQTGTTSRVSVDSSGSEGSGSSDFPSISDDGRFVAFTSGASNLVVGDTNGVNDVFVHDLEMDTTRLISVGISGSEGNSHSFTPSISGDGRFVAFRSYANNLVSSDTNGIDDIFVRDLEIGTTSLVSVGWNGNQGDRQSVAPSISSDGRFVAFSSSATNLVSGDTNGKYDVFVRDLEMGKTSLVSVDSSGSQGNSDSLYPRISDDGRFVAFYSPASNLVTDDTNGTWDIFVRDLQMDTTSLVSMNSSGTQGNSSSINPSISGNGRFVAFQSGASNLVSGDTNGVSNIFVKELGTVDTQNPTVTVNIVDTSLNDSDNSSLVTFEFSETVSGFTASDLTVVGGTISGFSGSGSSYSATFTAADNTNTTGSVAVAANSYTDTAGNNGAGGSDTVAIDTVNPTVTVNIVDASLNDADNSSTVTFTFSEAVTNFTPADIAVVSGTISGFSGSGSSYSGTFTAADNTNTTGSVTVATNSYTDTAGNNGAGGSDTVAIDTVNPTVTVNIVDASLNDADNSSTVTFTFSEAVTNFTPADIAVVSGTISGFSGSGSSYSGTFTAADNTNTTGSVTVAANSYTDTAGNNGAGGSDTVAIDTVNPTVTVNIVDASLNDADNSSTVTFAFSEAVVGFDAADLTLVGGTISGFSGSGSSYTATFTANDNSDTTGSVAVAANSYTDDTGNNGAGGSDTVDIDTVNPTVTVNIVDASLDISDNNSVVTFTFSEAVAGFTASDLTVVGGTISGFSGSGSSYTATFTAAANTDTTGSVTVDANSYTDAAGNNGASGNDTVAVNTVPDTTAPTITPPANVTLEAPADTDASNTGTATATDNVDPSPAITFSDVTTPGNCANGLVGNFVITRTWTATDASGNSASAVQTITSKDTTAPNLTVPADVQVGLGDSTDPSNTGTATATDAGSPPATVTYSDSQVGNVITRTWTATDGCRNQTSDAQNITIISVDLEVSISESAEPMVAGTGNLVHTVTVKNNGPSTATNIVIKFGANTFAAPSVGFSVGNNQPPNDPDQWGIPSLASGDSATMTLTWLVGDGYNDSNPIFSDAFVQSVDQTDTDSSNDSDSEGTNIVFDVDLTLDKDDGGATPMPGDLLIYSLTATNKGKTAALAVVFSETVPAGTTFHAGASDPAWSCSEGDPAGTVCTLNLSTSIGANGATITRYFSVNVLDGTGGADIINNASVVDGTGSSATAQAKTTVAFLPASCDLASEGPNYTVIRGTGKNDKLKGTPGNDIIIGYSGNDRLEGLGGNDCIIGGPGNDQLYGNEGNDILWGGELDNSTVYDSQDRDKLYGNDGDDEMHGGGDKDRLDGNDGNDAMYGNDGDDTMVGHDGDDSMYGGEGRDNMCGDDGDDLMYGEAGDDRLYGRQGDDTLDGGDDNDQLDGSAGTDTCVAGEKLKSCEQ